MLRSRLVKLTAAPDDGLGKKSDGDLRELYKLARDRKDVKQFKAVDEERTRRGMLSTERLTKSPSADRKSSEPRVS